MGKVAVGQHWKFRDSIWEIISLHDDRCHIRCVKALSFDWEEGFNNENYPVNGFKDMVWQLLPDKSENFKSFYDRIK